MINFSAITKALETQLKNAEATAAYHIDRGTPLNNDPALTPWAGIYRGALDYNAKTIGGRLWLVDVDIRVVVQAVNVGSPEEAEVALEEAIFNVLTAIETDRKIQGSVDIVLGYDVAGYSYAETDESTLSFQQAEITINAQVRV